MTKHRLLVITTGGTISGSVVASRIGAIALENKHDLDEYAQKWDSGGVAQVVARTADYLNLRLDLAVEVDVRELCAIDSSDVDPSIWSQLASLIFEEFDDFDSFIITHGTNTLGYTCAALSFALCNPGKPIILTGSQVPAGLPGTDAITNLENAIRVAVWRDPDNRGLRGVLAVFGSFIISGTRVKKATEFDYDAFESFHSGSIGRIGRIININGDNARQHMSYLTTARYNVARTRRDLVLESDFDMNIVSLTEFPGMDYRIFATLVERTGARGFILRAFGAGDPASTLRPAFEYLKTREIPIVVTTQAPNGNSNFQVNEPGAWLRANEMAIPAYDMSIEAQTTKLSWLLAQQNKGHLTYRDVCGEMVRDIRGEINVLWEFGV